MAKVIAPLFSFGAGGKLAKSIVFTSWKGIAAVRQYIIPANPKTAAQTTQRNSLTNAVSGWHDPNLTEADNTAWNSLASLSAKPLSGFNQYVKEHIRVENAGDTWTQLYNGASVDGASGEIDVSVQSADGISPCSVSYGTKKTLLLTTEALSFSVDTWSATITGLDSGVKYFFKFNQVDTGVEGITGIYEHVAP